MCKQAQSQTKQSVPLLLSYQSRCRIHPALWRELDPAPSPAVSHASCRLCPSYPQKLHFLEASSASG